MPYPRETTVRKYKNHDCWRTWYYEECEENRLFGVTSKYASQIKSYEIGTPIFLEDAPYRKHTDSHKIWGPYRIMESKPKGSFEIIKEDNGKIIIFKDNNPSEGPWFHNPNATRIIEGRECNCPQLAGDYGFNYYPYRFTIEHADGYNYYKELHTSTKCALCFKGR